MGVANNVCLTAMGAKNSQWRLYIQSSYRKADLPKMRDNDMKTAKVRADRNKNCPGKK